MELVNVYDAPNELDAELIKSILDSEGIPAMIKSEAYGRVLFGQFRGASFGGVQVLVRPEDAERAKAILEDVRIEPDLPDQESHEDE